jgi:lactoylglutathione lyase
MTITDIEQGSSAPAVNLGWVVIFVPDVVAALEFYERTFGLEVEFVDAGRTFGQLRTGSTALAFATNERAAGEIGVPFRRGSTSEPAANVEICLVFDDPHAAYQRALAAGCLPLAEPTDKPHGQTSGFVRDPFGTLIDIASPLRPAAR